MSSLPNLLEMQSGCRSRGCLESVSRLKEMLLPTLPVKASNRAPRCPGGVSLTAAATSCLILLRHGQSEWNLSNRFTGWADVPLTEQGRKDARYAGELLCEAGVKVG
jgi:hypothetical protein